MKKLLLTCITCLAAIDLMATGVVGVNSPQSGVDVFTYAVSTSSITNTFSPAYTEVPIITAFGSGTNVFTTKVTTTNLIISLASGQSVTNTAIAWTAQYGYPLIQSGTVALTPITLVTNTFPVSYGVVPVVLITGDNTNANCLAVVQQTNITTSYFVAKSEGTNNISWISFGRVPAPGSWTVTH